MRVLHFQRPIPEHQEAQSRQMLLDCQLGPPVHMEDLVRDLTLVEWSAFEVNFVGVLGLLVNKLPCRFPLVVSIVLLVKVAFEG